MDISEAFRTSPYQAKKHTSYFRAYERLLAQLRGRPITFVEVGVLNGGSLFMWRSFWGKGVRIIGVDMNPNARRWEQYGFEIYVGNQASPEFWKDFFDSVGQVDVLLDDGGHTFQQQIITCECAVPWIRDGGILIVEDTHTSYMSAFGGPSKRSFISYAKNIVDGINFRSGVLPTSNFEREIASVSFHESIVAFFVDRSVAAEKSSPIVNQGETFSEIDFRYADSFVGRTLDELTRRYLWLRKVPLFGDLLAGLANALKSALLSLSSRIRSLRLGRYFRY